MSAAIDASEPRKAQCERAAETNRYLLEHSSSFVLLCLKRKAGNLRDWVKKETLMENF